MILSRRLLHSLRSTREFLASPPELLRLSTVPSDAPQKIRPLLSSLVSQSEKLHQLQLRRVELLSLPASSVSVRNKELASLAVGALSGALSLSVHPGFAFIFYISYRMYRKARKPTEDRLVSQSTTVHELDGKIREVVREREGVLREVETMVEQDETVLKKIVKNTPN